MLHKVVRNAYDRSSGINLYIIGDNTESCFGGKIKSDEKRERKELDVTSKRLNIIVVSIIFTIKESII